MKTVVRFGITSLSLLLFVTTTSEVYAKGSSGGGSRSSFSSGSSSRSSSRPSSSSLYNKASSSSGGYSKASTSSSSASKTSSGYSKASAPTTNSGTSSSYYSKPSSSSSGGSKSQSAQNSSTKAPTAFAKGNRFDSDITRQMKQEKAAKSLSLYEADKSKFKNPPPVVDKKIIASNSVVTRNRVYSHVSYDDVLNRRQTIYRSWQPPVYVYNSAPYYGSWDSTFLWWALLHDASFFHHHSNDPAIMAWHNDAMRLSQQNQELKDQMATLDQKVLQLENTPRYDNYLPAQVEGDPIVALSTDAIAEIPVEKPVLRVATGIEGGQYNQIGHMLKNRSEEVQIELVSTSGAEENLKLMKEGKVDAAIVQSDIGCILSKNSTETPVSTNTFHRATLYSEYVMLIVSKDSSIKSIQDLGPQNTVCIGPEGSGSALTWQGFGMQDERYKNVKSEHMDYKSALTKVGSDKTTALFFVAGMNTPLLKGMSNKDHRYQIIPVDDEDFSKLKDSEGNNVYDVLTLPARTYVGMQEKEIQTVGVDAEWTISDSWIKKYGEGSFDQINYSVIDIVNDLHKKSHEESVNTHHGSAWFYYLLFGACILLFLYWFIFKFNLTGGHR